MAAGARVAAWRSAKIDQMLKGHEHALSDIIAGRQRLAPQGYDVWFHAASLGEFEQARTMIEKMLAHNPDAAILLTFFSPSGYNVRRNFHPRVQTAYLPFDKPQNVRQFLDAAAPRAAVFVKYEFWGNYLSELKRRGIPTYIVSAIFRPGQIFFKPWGGMFRKMLECFDHIFVQDDSSRDLLAGIGVNNVTVAGDTRFDRVAHICSQAVKRPEVEAFLNGSDAHGPRLVVGSSWPADENVYIPFLHAHTDICAIIAPHEFDSQRICTLRNRLGESSTAVLSELRAGLKAPDKARFLIIDCFGWLSSLYGYADFAYVGGGFGAGLHNINEAAAFGIPVIYGPNNHKFKEAADMAACGAGFCIHSANEFDKVAGTLIDNKQSMLKAGKKAAEYIQSHIGATDIVMRHMFGI